MNYLEFISINYCSSLLYLLLFEPQSNNNTHTAVGTTAAVVEVERAHTRSADAMATTKDPKRHKTEYYTI